MSSFIRKGPDITIPNAGTVSNVIKAHDAFFDSLAMTLFGPSALDALTVSIEVSDDPDADVPVWCGLTSDGTTPVIPPGASLAVTIHRPTFAGLRIKASAAVAADRTWKVNLAELVTT